MARNILATISRSTSCWKAVLAASALLWSLAGCGSDKATSPVRPVPLMLVALSDGQASARYRAPLPAATVSGAAADSDSVVVTFTKALLVVRDVRFVRPDDLDGGGEFDSTGASDSLDVEDGDGGQVIFRGPFVLNALSGEAARLDTLMVLPGDFVRVQGHLQPLHAGDEDAPALPDLVGSTVWIEGTIAGDGGGPFSFRVRIDDEFQIRGGFHVAADTPATAFIVFDPVEWLTARDGRFLDPRDPDNEQAIKSAIRHAIKVGVDGDHDGDLDDNEARDGD